MSFFLKLFPFRSPLVGQAQLTVVNGQQGYSISPFAITDTNQHSYRTDPSYIRLIRLGLAEPSIRAFAVWVFNNENQTLTVYPIANVTDSGTYPDVNIVSPSGAQSFTVPAGQAYIASFSFEDYPLEYFSVILQYSTAPTGPSNSSLPFGVTAVLYAYW